MSERVGGWADSAALYDMMAPRYDSFFEEPGYRRAYDRLAGEYIGRLLPSNPGVIVDAGCGTGRWARRWLDLGHRVIGIEQSPRMIAELKRRDLGDGFRLIAASMDEAEIEPGSADLVVAMGSLQYVADPAAVLRRFRDWVRPGGHVCIYTDSLMALVLELIRMGRPEEAQRRLETRRGGISASSGRQPPPSFTCSTARRWRPCSPRPGWSMSAATACWSPPAPGTRCECGRRRS